jgi:hypothetical protein
MKRMISLIFVSVTFCVALSASIVFAQSPFQTLCSQSNADNSAVCTDSKSSTNPISGPNGIILDVANIIAFAAGVAAIIMIIVSGIRYITANGESNSISSAKNTLIYSIVGIVVIVSARAIIGFVIGKI